MVPHRSLTPVALHFTVHGYRRRHVAHLQQALTRRSQLLAPFSNLMLPLHLLCQQCLLISSSELWLETMLSIIAQTFNVSLDYPSQASQRLTL